MTRARKQAQQDFPHLVAHTRIQIIPIEATRVGSVALKLLVRFPGQFGDFTEQFLEPFWSAVFVAERAAACSIGLVVETCVTVFVVRASRRQQECEREYEDRAPDSGGHVLQVRVGLAVVHTGSI